MKALSIAAFASMALSFAGHHAAAMPLRPSLEQGANAASTPRSAASDDNGAIEDLQKTLAQRPGWTEGWWKLGTAAYSADRFALAQDALAKVVAAVPQMGPAWCLLGLSEFETGHYDDARKHLEQGEALGDVEDEDVQRVAEYHLALLLLRTADFDRATALLRQTGGADPNPQVTFALGLAALHVPLLPSEVDPSQEALVSAAGALVSRGERALSEFPAFLAANPRLPFAHYTYGRALEAAGRYPDALAQMRTETAVSPASPLPWQSIARLEEHVGDGAAARAARAKAAALSHTGASGPEPRLAALYRISTANTAAGANGGDALFNKAMGAYASGDYANTVAALKPWLAQHAGDGTAWAVLGLSEFALGDQRSALLHLQRGDALGLRGSPESIKTARYTIGILLLQGGDFDRASEVLARVAEVFPNDVKVQYALGLALLHRGELPGVTPAANAPLVNAAGAIALLLEGSKYDEAFAQFKPLLAQYPSTPFLHYAYGTALMTLSEFDEAAAQMRAEMAISPASALPYVRLASIALRQHHPADALAPARRALALAPGSADAHYLLGRASLETGDDRTAIQELEEARQLSPGSPEVHFNLARAYARAKRTDDAAAERATFARLNELSEAGKSGGGSQIYSGPREQTTVTAAPAASPQ